MSQCTIRVNIRMKQAEPAAKKKHPDHFSKDLMTIVLLQSGLCISPSTPYLNN